VRNKSIHSVKHADEGSQGSGSGFLVGVPAKKITGASFIFAVANQHIFGADVIRLKMVDGRKKIIEAEPRNRIPHPNGDDLAVEKNGSRARADRAGNLNFSPFGQAGPCGGGPNQ
jgi:hypothetical protein